MKLPCDAITGEAQGQMTVAPQADGNTVPVTKHVVGILSLLTFSGSASSSDQAPFDVKFHVKSYVKLEFHIPNMLYLSILGQVGKSGISHIP